MKTKNLIKIIKILNNNIDNSKGNFNKLKEMSKDYQLKEKVFKIFKIF